jgi:hypothetical protein
MTTRFWLALPLAGALLVLSVLTLELSACAPCHPSGKPVVNADQTVVLLWDAASQTEHFIRRASFKSQADDFGFLVPSPSYPNLEESGDRAFPYLQKITEPERQRVPRSSGMECGCTKSNNISKSTTESKSTKESVTVLEEKTVAGFDAAVLETRSAGALVGWLKDHGYAFSPQVEAWAKPYVESGWKITALKVTKDKDARDKQSVAASALRISFKAERPLFPYREPDPRSAAHELGATHRLLRLYFLAEARYQGKLTEQAPWTGRVAWANKLSDKDRTQILSLLSLPATTGPTDCWLTEFEHDWPYRVAPADLYFARDSNQDTVKRPPIIEYVSSPWPTDVMAIALAAAMILPPLARRVRRRVKRLDG